MKKLPKDEEDGKNSNEIEVKKENIVSYDKKNDVVVKDDETGGKKDFSEIKKDESIISKSGNKDHVEIPVGKYVQSLRKNPWMSTSIVLLIVLVVVVFTAGRGANVTGNVIGEGDVGAANAAKNLIDFVNSQGQGEANLVSVVQEGTLYLVKVNFDGQEIPAYVTLDGKFLITQPIPLTDELPNLAVGKASEEPEIVEVDLENKPVLGDDDAPITMLEFSDYECPFCGRHYSETHGKLKTEYIDNGDVKLIFSDLPLDIHPEAEKAAEAAQCVRKQRGDDAYFEMHDKLFENQISLSVENYKKWARLIKGIDGAKFDKCLDDGEFEDFISDELNYAQSVEMFGTPGFFILTDADRIDSQDLLDMQVFQGGDYLVRYIESDDGQLAGVKISGALPYNAFDEVLRKMLE